MTGFFLIAQMAGAGFLALPRATADTGKDGTSGYRWVEVGEVRLWWVIVG